MEVILVKISVIKKKSEIICLFIFILVKVKGKEIKISFGF